jgi:Concanavalin A-like lectin/glucanases superfamily
VAATLAGLRPPTTGADRVAWESLIAIKPGERSVEPASPERPDPRPALAWARVRRPPWFWTAIIAASVFGALVFGVINNLATDRTEPSRRPSNETSASGNRSPAIEPKRASKGGQTAKDGGPRAPAKTALETTDLIAFYTFDKGDASDTSGHGNHGTLSSNPPTPESRGFEEGAFRFLARQNNFITIPVNINPSVMPQITIGGWFNANAANVVGTLVSHDDGDFDRTLDIDSRTRFRWSCFIGIGVLPGSFVSAKRWTFVALRHDQSSGRLLLNVGRERFSSTGVFFGSGRDRTTIGRNPGFGAPIDGLIDNIFIYKSALSDAKIEDIRSRGQAAILALGGG